MGDYAYSGRTDVRPYRMMLHAYRLVLPFPDEVIDAKTPDPFLNSVDPLWKPQKSFVDSLDSVSDRFVKSKIIGKPRSQRRALIDSMRKPWIDIFR